MLRAPLADRQRPDTSSRSLNRAATTGSMAAWSRWAFLDDTYDSSPNRDRNTSVIGSPAPMRTGAAF